MLISCLYFDKDFLDPRSPLNVKFLLVCVKQKASKSRTPELGPELLLSSGDVQRSPFPSLYCVPVLGCKETGKHVDEIRTWPHKT